MQLATFVGVADAPVIALARLRLSKAGLKMLCTTRAQAINILRSVRPAISKTTPLAQVIKPAEAQQDLCRKCGKPIRFGTPCKVCFNGEVPEHINCKKPSKKRHDTALSKLYREACEQVLVVNSQGRRQ